MISFYFDSTLISISSITDTVFHSFDLRFSYILTSSTHRGQTGHIWGSVVVSFLLFCTFKIIFTLSDGSNLWLVVHYHWKNITLCIEFEATFHNLSVTHSRPQNGEKTPLRSSLSNGSVPNRSPKKGESRDGVTIISHAYWMWSLYSCDTRQCSDTGNQVWTKHENAAEKTNTSSTGEHSHTLTHKHFPSDMHVSRHQQQTQFILTLPEVKKQYILPVSTWPDAQPTHDKHRYSCLS